MATNVLDRLEALLAKVKVGPVFNASGMMSTWDIDAYLSLRNAAPALIRLARGAMEMVGCAERCEKGEDISQAQVDAMGAEIESAAKALGEVRL